MAKRIGRKNINLEILEKMFEPSGNIAFFDAEFNAGMDYKTGEKVNEIISIGLVICDSEYNGLKKYYSLVKPVSKTPVFPMITKMTGITTEMLKDQPSFAEVSNKLTEQIKKYGVKHIFTWGAADRHSLESEKTIYRKKRYPGYQQASKWNYIDMLVDVSGAVSGHMLGIKGGLSINMENLMFICDIDQKQEHNALSDARHLFLCSKFLRTHYPVSGNDKGFQDKRRLVNQFYQEKSTYNSFRRFKNNAKSDDLYGRWTELEGSPDIRIKALMDDIKFLKGEIPLNTEFESLQDYFSNHMEE